MLVCSPPLAVLTRSAAQAQRQLTKPEPIRLLSIISIELVDCTSGVIIVATNCVRQPSGRLVWAARGRGALSSAGAQS